MADTGEKKKRDAGRCILDKHIRRVTSVVKANPNDFFQQLLESSLVSRDAYDPENIALDKEQQATKLYLQCGAAVGIASSNFSKVVDILSGHPLLDQVVDEMNKEGKKAGLIEERSAVTSTSQEVSTQKSELIYFQQVFYRQFQGNPPWKLDFLLIPHDKCSLVENKYKEWTPDIHQQIEFDEPEDNSRPSITLNVVDTKDEEQKNWIIRLRNGGMLRKDVVDKFDKDMPFPLCQFTIKWKGETTPVFPEVSRRVDLIGARRPNNHFLIELPELHAESPQPRPVNTLKPEKTYYHQVFYQKSSKTSWKLHFLLTPTDKYSLVMNEYNKDHWTHDFHQQVEFQDSPCQSITLRVAETKEKKQKDWSVLPSGGCRLLKEVVDKFDKDMPPPVCQLTIKWKGKKKSGFPAVSRRVDLVGAKDPNDHFLIELPA